MVRALAALACACLALSSAPAHADGLSPVERDRLASGGTVVRLQSLVHGARRYVGGVSYGVVDAPADRVTDALATADEWRRVLPRTRSARHVGAAGGDELLELTQGSALMQARYTVRVRREGRELRFWMDPGRPHDIEDAWGFLRAEPLAGGRTLVAFGVLIDLGPGLVRDLFESRIRDLALSVPDRLRDVVAEQSAAGRRASE